MTDPVVRVREVGKRYARGLRQAQRYGLTAIGAEVIPRLRPDAELRDSEFWALRGVSFDLHEGEALGVLGRNGAGKSTLLRVAAGITRPDEGEVRVIGRVGALLDPKAGFDPILSGRENLEVAHTLMTGRRPDRATADRIVDYAELGTVIDAPVRTYSHGMMLRLGFSVMVHSQLAVLLIDEALAVGDTAFQLRCLDRLHAHCRDGGALLFVSHSLWLFQHLASRGVHLVGGEVDLDGAAHEVADRYLFDLQAGPRIDNLGGDDSGPEGHDSASGIAVEGPGETAGVMPGVMQRPVVVTAVRVSGPGGAPTSESHCTVEVDVVASEEIPAAELAFTMWTQDSSVCVTGDLSHDVAGGLGDGTFSLPLGRSTLRYRTDDLPLAPGAYLIKVALYELETGDVIGLHGYEDSPTFFEVVADVDSGDDAVDPSGDRSLSGLRPLRSIRVEWGSITDPPASMLRSEG